MSGASARFALPPDERPADMQPTIGDDDAAHLAPQLALEPKPDRYAGITLLINEIGNRLDNAAMAFRELRHAKAESDEAARIVPSLETHLYTIEALARRAREAATKIRAQQRTKE